MWTSQTLLPSAVEEGLAKRDYYTSDFRTAGGFSVVSPSPPTPAVALVSGIVKQQATGKLTLPC